MVERYVARGEFKNHLLYASVGQDAEADTHSTLLQQRRPRRFRDDGPPGTLCVVDHAVDVGTEVDAHGIAEDVDGAVDSGMLRRCVCTHVTATADLSRTHGVARGLLDGLASGGCPSAEVRLRGSGLWRLKLCLVVVL